MWYGVTYIECKECGDTNPYGADLGVGGHFNIPKDHVKIFNRPTGFVVELMAHELGHRYWFKNLNESQRQRFRDWFLDGSVPSVSKYGQINAEEAFAEVVAHAVMGKDITRDQLESLKAILRDKGSRLSMISRIAKRFVEANTFDQDMDHDFEEFEDPIDKFRKKWMDIETNILKSRDSFKKKVVLPLLQDPRVGEEDKKTIQDVLEGNSRTHSLRLMTPKIRYFDKEPFLDDWRKNRAEAKKIYNWLVSRYGKETDPTKMDTAVSKAIHVVGYSFGSDWPAVS